MTHEDGARRRQEQADVAESPSLVGQIDLLAGKWVLPILRTLETGAHRPVEISRHVRGISEKVLHGTLRRMRARGLITRTSYPGAPPIVEYSLTQVGEEAVRAARILSPDSVQEATPSPSDDAREEMYGPDEYDFDDSLWGRTVSPGTASTARMYDYYLGGKDNFEADRDAAERILAIEPTVRHNTRANRRFLVRAVRLLAELGVTQFIDLGSGIPTSPNVHEVARVVQPSAQVVYVDNDPVAVAHNRALNETQDGVVAIDADIRHSASIHSHPVVQRTLDFTRPIAVLLVSMLHFFDDADTEHILTGIRSWMPSGSYLVLSVNGDEGATPERIRAAADIYAHADVKLILRSRAEVRSFFAGYELIEPGVVPVGQWRAEEPVTPAAILAGVGHLSDDHGKAASQ